jgi:hypothetical protein
MSFQFIEGYHKKKKKVDFFFFMLMQDCQLLEKSRSLYICNNKKSIKKGIHIITTYFDAK